MSAEIKFLTLAELDTELEHIRQSPKEDGTLVMIVCRPGVDVREVLGEGSLNPAEGLAGDRWKQRHNSKPPTKPEDFDTQLTLMNSRVIALLAQSRDRWSQAGDQLFVDFDLSAANLPPGTRLAIGGAVIEVTAEPHTGCSKFKARYGADALKFVNSPVGRQLNLRGVNAKVVQSGVIRPGDVVKKTPRP